MATEVAIDIAARGDYRPPVSATMHHEGDSTLHRPRAAADIEAAERRQAARTVFRMALGRHDCPALAACPTHGQEPCGCVLCVDPRHAGDVQRAREVLETCGLSDSEPVAQLRCSTCHRSKPITRFSKTRETCKTCLSKRKTDRDAEGQA